MITNKLRFKFCARFSASGAQKSAIMTTAILIALALVGAYIVGQRSTKAQIRDFDTAFKSRYTGVFPVWCDGPNDTEVEKRAEFWRAEFKKFGNDKVTVISYPYNKVLDTGKNALSTITMDYQSTMVMYCRHYLEITNSLHITATAVDATAAARHLAGQQITN